MVLADVLFLLCCILKETPEKSSNLDDDEDRKNPAYIPRKGAFYEHDLRSGDPQATEDDKKYAL